MLVAAGEAARPHLRIRHANVERGDGVAGDLPAFAPVKQPVAGIALQRRHHDVLLCRHLQEQPLLFAVFGEETDAARNGVARRMDGDLLPVDPDLAAAGFTYAENQLRQLAAPSAHQSGQADDFAGAHRQAARPHLAAVGQVIDRQANLAERDSAILVKEIAQRTADHHAHQLAGVQGVMGQAADILPVAQHADAIGELIHFRHTVADIDNRHAFRPQALDQREELLGFAVAQRGGGFVHYQNAAVAVQRARDLDLLLFGDAEAADAVGGAKPCAEPIDHLLRLFGHLPTPNQPAARDFAAEKDVLRHRQVGRQVDLLIDQRDACRQRLFRSPDGTGAPVDQDFAAGGAVGAGEDLHQGALARAVLAHQRVDLPGIHRQINALERVKLAEAPRDVAHLQNRCGCHGPLQITVIKAE